MQGAQNVAKFYCCPNNDLCLITGKEYASKDWTCVISMFVTSFNV